jgi:choline-sulfatase
VDSALHYHFDWAATLVEMVGGSVPENWDGIPFTAALRAGEEQGRDDLVISQGAWSCQRGVRFRQAGEEYLCLRTYHDGHKMLEPLMLFNLTRDPHEQVDLRASKPQLVDQAMRRLADWEREMMLTSRTDVDPMLTVLREGGAHHTHGFLPDYLKRLRATGRAAHADKLARLHPDEVNNGGES